MFHTQGLVDKKGAPLITITKVPSYGFYGGEAEPSLSLQIEMKNIDKPRTLAALARFADMFNQEQIHVREAPAKNKKKVGYQYTDGSMNTSVVKYELNEQLTEQELTKIIDESGLVGFTVGEDGSLLAYYLETQMTQKQSKTLKQPSNEPTNLLEKMHERLPGLLNASGLTVEDTEPQIATGTSKVTFVPRKMTKPTNQQ